MNTADRYRENPNAPQIRFIRKNGRVIPLISGPRTGVKPRVAATLVSEQIGAMDMKVEMADAGKRIHSGYGIDHEVRGIPSTYPKFYSELGFRSKQDFRSTLDKPGAKQFRLFDRAIQDLKRGEDYGVGLPDRSTQFKVATRQIFDNYGVVFRRINGKVVPIHTKKQMEHPKATIEEPWL